MTQPEQALDYNESPELEHLGKNLPPELHSLITPATGASGVGLEEAAYTRLIERTRELLESQPDSLTMPHVAKQLKLLASANEYAERINTLRVAGMPLRPTQRLAIKSFRDWLRESLFKEPMMGHIVHPFGSGKTNEAVLLSEMVPGRTVVIAYGNKEKIQEAFELHQKTLPDGDKRSVGACYGGKYETNKDIIIAHFASVHKWLENIDWQSVGLIIVDEADVNGLSEKRSEALKQLSENYSIPVVATTATEEQASGKKLQQVFPDEISRLGVPEAFQECLEMGITAPMTFYDLYLDLEMKLDEDEYLGKQDIPDASVDEFIRSNAWIELILDDYLSRFKSGGDLNTAMLILRDNTLVEQTLKAAKKRGIRAKAYTGEVSDDERMKRQRSLAKGKLDMLVGSRLLGRGLHIPGVRVVYNSTITRSPQLFWQANGRVASVDEENPYEESHVIAVLPKAVIDKKTGLLLSPEHRPFCHAAFFDEDYYDGLDATLFETGFIDNQSVVRRRGPTPPETKEFELENVEMARTIKEVNAVTHLLKLKSSEATGRSRAVADFIDHTHREMSKSWVDFLIRTESYKMRAFIKSALSESPLAEPAEEDDLPGSVTYLKDLAESAPILMAVEEKELMNRAREGDQEARNDLIHAHLPLIIAVAKKMQVPGLDLSDFVHETVADLMSLLNRDKVFRGGLTGYVVMTAFGTMQRLIENESRDVRLTVGAYSRVRKLQNECYRSWRALMISGDEPEIPIELVYTELGVNPQDQEKPSRILVERVRQKLAEDFKNGVRPRPTDIVDVPAKAEKLMQAYHMQEVGFDEEVHSQGDLREEEVEAFRRVMADQTLLHLYAAQTNLSPIEEKIVDYRFSLGDHSDEEPLKLEEAGKKIGLSRERVRQIQKEALRKMRDWFLQSLATPVDKVTIDVE